MSGFITGNLWRHADFMRMWAAQAVSAFGARITREGLPLAAVLTIEASAFELSVLAALAMGPGLVVGLMAGGYVDRSRRRPILIAMDIVRAAVLMTVPFAAWSGLLSMPQLYVVAACVGAASVLFDIADNAYLPSLIRSEDLIEGNAKINTTGSLAEIGGPALSGILFQLLTVPVAIAVNAMTYLVSAGFLATIRKAEAPPPPAEEAASLSDDMKLGLSAIIADPYVRPIFVITLAEAFFGSFLAGLYVLYAIDTLGLTPAMMGITIATGGLGALAGAVLGPMLVERLGVGRTILLAGVGYGAWLAMAVLMVAQFVGDGLAVAGGVVAVSLRQTVLPLNIMGRVGAAFHVGTGSLAVLGALLGGGLAMSLGIRETLFIAAAGLVVAPLWAMLSPLWHQHDMPPSPEQNSRMEMQETGP
ncbi:MFS transporter [Nordella sp. HKS 07]|uniref:MFS transporter n=1 Tax=Nordella sp. HKS 07 TaxID=2712222 RepID=UPI0013E14CE0|nr:MFS transporter [Nordella sp. HKS 07]QIG50686.1 MFS transporter [Nordella sp. HKS 07]